MYSNIVQAIEEAKLRCEKHETIYATSLIRVLDRKLSQVRELEKSGSEIPQELVEAIQREVDASEKIFGKIEN